MPPIAVPQNTQNRVHVSITPPQMWLKRTSSSCGKVSKKWRLSVAHVAGRLSSSAETLPRQ